jgi:hypothetical protein
MVGPFAALWVGFAAATSSVPQANKLKLWLKADVLSTDLNVGDPVTIWPDSSPDNRDFSGSAGPTIALDSLGNLVAAFDNQQHLTSGSDYLFSNNADGMEIWCAATPTGSSPSFSLFDFGKVANEGYGVSLVKVGSGRKVQLYTPVDHGGAMSLLEFTPSNSGHSIVRLRIRFDQDQTLEVDGASSTDIITLPGLTSDQIMAMSATGAGGPPTIGIQSKSSRRNERYFNGQLAEFMVFDTVLSDSEATSLRSYLHNKWNPTPAPTFAPTPVPTPVPTSLHAPACSDSFLKLREKTCGPVPHIFRNCDAFVSANEEVFNCRYSCMCNGRCGSCDCSCMAHPEF